MKLSPDEAPKLVSSGFRLPYSGAPEATSEARNKGEFDDYKKMIPMTALWGFEKAKWFKILLVLS